MAQTVEQRLDMTKRSMGRVAVHYALERELSDRLRTAPADERARVYGEVYNELFWGRPDHPQLAIGSGPAQSGSARKAAIRVAFPR